MMLRSWMSVAFFALMVLVQQVHGAALIGVDLGTLFTKTSLLLPGRLFDIVLSPDSKRKLHSGLGVLKQERLYGSEAFGLFTRLPGQTVWNIRDLLGVNNKDEKFVKDIIARSRSLNLCQVLNPNEARKLLHERLVKDSEDNSVPFVEDSSGSLYVLFGKGTEDEQIFSVEEVIAMMLQHVVENAEKHGPTNSITSSVLVVPSFFTPFQRQAYLDAASIAGLSVSSLMDENSAAAVEFAIDRNFNEEPTNILIFNMGAASTQVTVARFTGKNDTKTKQPGRVVNIAGKSWDTSLGGDDFDTLLIEFIANEFDAKHTKPGSPSIKTVPRAMARIMKEAQKVKEILSANEFMPVTIENLHADTDLRVHTTRKMFEELASGLLTRITPIIDAALLKANLTKDQLHGVELIGGGIRVPSVRNVIQNYFGADKELGYHLNGDESMVLGAAFRAANMSTFFRVPRKVEYYDTNAFSVGLRLSGSTEEGEAKPLDQMGGILFPQGTPMGAKKRVKRFVRKSNFSVFLHHIESADVEISVKEIAKYSLFSGYEITGFEEVLKSHGKFGDPSVRLEFEYNGNGIPVLDKAEAMFEEEYVVNATEANSTSSSNTTTETDASSKDSNNTTTTVTKTRKYSVLLKITKIHDGLSVRSMSDTAKEVSINVLHQWKKQDDLRRLRAQTRNDLETFILMSRDKLRDDEERVKSVTTEEDWEKLFEAFQDAEDWMFTDIGQKASIKEVQSKRAELQKLVNAIHHRLSEREERPESIKAMRSLFTAIRKRLNELSEDRPWLMEEEKNVVLKYVEGTETWLDEQVALQEKLTDKDAPVLTTNDMRIRVEKIQSSFEKLMKKKIPKDWVDPNAPPPPDAATANTAKQQESETSKEKESSSSDSDSNDKDSTSAGEEEVEEEDIFTNNNDASSTKEEAEKDEL